ncbi:MAG: DUF5666 domain-containing protein [Acidobacteria bacterium]|nr:DUF5666 domain-containing protein [Acidobacteriota bacterium]
MNLRLPVLAAVLVAACAAACNDSSGTSSLTAPSSLSSNSSSATTSGAATTPTGSGTPGQGGGPGGPGQPPPLPEGMKGAHGEIGGLSGTCPSLSFTLEGTTFRTNGSTQFIGGTCEGVKSGEQAGAMGTPQDDGSVLAVGVQLGEPPDKGEGPGKPPADGTGAHGQISNVSGACPAVAFTLGDKAVKTTAGTKYDAGSCAEIKNGVQAGAVGTLEGSTLVAERMQIGNPPPPPKR